jgi:hypothetical protein
MLMVAADNEVGEERRLNQKEESGEEEEEDKVPAKM